MPPAFLLVAGLLARRNPRDHLDLEIEASQPVHADGRPVGVGPFTEHLLFDGHDRSELVLRIGVKGRDIDDVVERAAGSFQCRLQIVEGQFNLAMEIRFGGTVRTAADLAGDEQQVAGADRGGVAVLFIEGVPVGWEDGVALGHVDLFS